MRPAFVGLWDLFRVHGSFRLMYAAANMLGFDRGVATETASGTDEGLTVSLRKALPP